MFGPLKQVFQKTSNIKYTCDNLPLHREFWMKIRKMVDATQIFVRAGFGPRPFSLWFSKAWVMHGRLWVHSRPRSSLKLHERPHDSKTSCLCPSFSPSLFLTFSLSFSSLPLSVCLLVSLPLGRLNPFPVHAHPGVNWAILLLMPTEHDKQSPRASTQHSSLCCAASILIPDDTEE